MSVVELLRHLINISLKIIITYFFYQSIQWFIPLKENRYLRIISYFLLYLTISLPIFPQDPVNIFAVLILFLLIILIGFQGNLVQKISVVAILLPLVISSNFVFEELGLRIYIFFKGSPLLNDFLHLFFLILKIPFWYGVSFVFQKNQPITKKIMHPVIWRAFCLASLSSLIGIIFIIILAPNDSWITFPAMLAVMLTSFAIQYLISYISEAVKKELENKNLKLQAAHYLEIEKNQQAIRKLKHDFNSHLGVIASFLNNDQYIEAKQYFSELTPSYTKKNRTFCKNPLINNILNTKYEQAHNANIDFFIHIDLNQLLGIDNISLCTIFANTLENAIEACEKLSTDEPKKISLKARYYQGYFTYQIINSTTAKLSLNNKDLRTTKKDKLNHGFGLSNVEDAVDKYDGSLTIQQEEDTFSVLILISNV